MHVLWKYITQKHHQGYTIKVNAALEGTAHAESSIEDVLANISSLPADKQQAVINNGGGFANHSLFGLYFRQMVVVIPQVV